MAGAAAKLNFSLVSFLLMLCRFDGLDDGQVSATALRTRNTPLWIAPSSPVAQQFASWHRHGFGAQIFAYAWARIYRRWPAVANASFSVGFFLCKRMTR